MAVEKPFPGFSVSLLGNGWAVLPKFRGQSCQPWIKIAVISAGLVIEALRRCCCKTICNEDEEGL